jgi:hypothetical protein
LESGFAHCSIAHKGNCFWREIDASDVVISISVHILRKYWLGRMNSSSWRQ